MDTLDIKKPSKEEQRTAMESYDALAATLEQLRSETPEIEIEATGEKIRIPLSALNPLSKILKEISQGRPVSIISVAPEMTTQTAAELLGCSRPHVVKLLEEGKIEYTKVGKHRRIKYEDVVNYRNKFKSRQKKLIEKVMKADEESGLYDS